MVDEDSRRLRVSKGSKFRSCALGSILPKVTRMVPVNLRSPKPIIMTGRPSGSCVEDG
jgi:hypothetical protein